MVSDVGAVMVGAPMALTAIVVLAEVEVLLNSSSAVTVSVSDPIVPSVSLNDFSVLLTSVRVPVMVRLVLFGPDTVAAPEAAADSSPLVSLTVTWKVSLLVDPPLLAATLMPEIAVG